MKKTHERLRGPSQNSWSAQFFRDSWFAVPLYEVEYLFFQIINRRETCHHRYKSCQHSYFVEGELRAVCSLVQVPSSAQDDPLRTSNYAVQTAGKDVCQHTSQRSMLGNCWMGEHDTPESPNIYGSWPGRVEYSFRSTIAVWLHNPKPMFINPVR